LSFSVGTPGVVGNNRNTSERRKEKKGHERNIAKRQHEVVVSEEQVQLGEGFLDVNTVSPRAELLLDTDQLELAVLFLMLQV
jgi:hypothetical protein